MSASFFKKLRDKGYEISIQGSKQGSLAMHDGNLKLFSDLSLPDSIIDDAKAAGAIDHRTSITEIAADLNRTDGVTAKQLNLIRSQIDDADDAVNSSPKLS